MNFSKCNLYEKQNIDLTLMQMYEYFSGEICEDVSTFVELFPRDWKMELAVPWHCVFLSPTSEDLQQPFTSSTSFISQMTSENCVGKERS